MAIILTPGGHRLGYKKSNKFHKLKAKAMPRLDVTVAADVDLRSWFPGVGNQGAEGSCTGWATKEFRETLHGSLKQQIIPVRLSPAYLYAKTRMAEGSFPADDGATIADEFAVLQADGVCPEADLPYDAEPDETPTAKCDEDAPAYRIPDPTMVPADEQSMKLIFSLGRPIGISMPVYPSFENVGSNGKVPAPGEEQSLGGHGLCLLGYNGDGWIGVNSWGTNWGDGGFFYLPFGYEKIFWELFTDVSDVSLFPA